MLEEVAGEAAPTIAAELAAEFEVGSGAEVVELEDAAGAGL
jgi:hypothetical protein